jgi:predicted outer membrane repeat protein
VINMRDGRKLSIINTRFGNNCFSPGPTSDREDFDNYDIGLGGSIYLENSEVTVESSQFTANNAKKRGGAIYMKGSNAIFGDVTFLENTSQTTNEGAVNKSGGAIYAKEGSVVSITGSSNFNLCGFP